MLKKYIFYLYIYKLLQSAIIIIIILLVSINKYLKLLMLFIVIKSYLTNADIIIYK